MKNLERTTLIFYKTGQIRRKTTKRFKNKKNKSGNNTLNWNDTELYSEPYFHINNFK